MFAKPGTPCNDYIGYCDVFQKCREVDPSGPLATLRKLLLSEESIASFKKWVISNWYAVSLIIVAVFALLVSFACKSRRFFFSYVFKQLLQLNINHEKLRRFLKKWENFGELCELKKVAFWERKYR